MQLPFARGLAIIAVLFGSLEGPDFDLAAEAYAGSHVADAAARRAHVVAAEFVGGRDGLLEREGRVGSAVDAEGGGAASRAEGGRSRSEGEDLCSAGWRSVLVRVARTRKNGGVGCAPSSIEWAVRYCLD